MDFYKFAAKGYNELYEEEQKIKLNKIKENLSIQNNDLLLDVGCGTGLSSCFNCKVVGIDPSLELLWQNPNELKISAKAENLPFKDHVFDKVIAVTSIHNFDGIEKGIKEIKRVGRNDFAFSILKKSNKFGFIEKIIKKNFIIKTIIDGDKDWIFICNS